MASLRLLPGLGARSLAAFGRQLLSKNVRQQWRGCGVLWVRSYSEGNPQYTREYFEGLVKGKPLVLFMKGEPSAPMCGFSRLVVQILHMHGLLDYPHYNVLEDVEFKEGMKKFSNWPTFPQVYMNGELVGGSDIMLQMHQSGELVTELEGIGHRSAVLDKQNQSDQS